MTAHEPINLKKHSRFAWLYIHLAVAILVLFCSIGGLTLIQNGADNLLQSDGRDEVRVSMEQIGEMEIISTREVMIIHESVVKIVIGLALIAAGLYATQGIKQHFL
ncbi:MAG TPA: hypothetical protein VJZ27_12525 [Aggregatilineales bacterium]|nr:hypothetical protein [Aggregatilineales bacterium]